MTHSFTSIITTTSHPSRSRGVLNCDRLNVVRTKTNPSRAMKAYADFRCRPGLHAANNCAARGTPRLLIPVYFAATHLFRLQDNGGPQESAGAAAGASSIWTRHTRHTSHFMRHTSLSPLTPGAGCSLWFHDPFCRGTSSFTAHICGAAAFFSPDASATLLIHSTFRLSTRMKEEVELGGLEAEVSVGVEGFNKVVKEEKRCEKWEMSTCSVSAE